jgi:hypothetical protein
MVNNTASPSKTIPSLVRWKYKAPAIRPIPSKAPRPVVRGYRMSTEATSSKTPVPYRPQGSIPSCVNKATDCGCAENLKYRVCSMIAAATTRKIQLNTMASFIQKLVESAINNRRQHVGEAYPSKTQRFLACSVVDAWTEPHPNGPAAAAGMPSQKYLDRLSYDVG